MPKSSLCIVFIFYFTLSILSYIVFYCILIPNNFSISLYFLPLIYLSGGFPLNSTLLLNRPCLFLISRREKEESSIYLSQVSTLTSALFGHISIVPSHSLSDWSANRMCADTWPAVTLLTPPTVNTDRPHAVSPSGQGVLISRVAPNPSWLLSDIRSIRPGKVDTRNVENVIGQKQPCRKSLGLIPFIFNQSSWPWDGWKHKKCMANSLWASPGLSHSN